MPNPLTKAALELRESLRGHTFPEPVAYTYQPLDYAWDNHAAYLEKYGSGKKRAVFLGMNPGPWGMTQTGVPFGEIAAVRGWLQIEGPVGKPEGECPKRPVTGFSCPKSEVSGRRLWGLFQELYGSAEDFFEDNFVANFCPLVWMTETGANVTPDKIPAASMTPVVEACQVHLAKTLEALEPEILVGIGVWAEKQLKAVARPGQVVGKILHPSPASPAANRDFAGTATKQLQQLGLL